MSSAESIYFDFLNKNLLNKNEKIPVEVGTEIKRSDDFARVMKQLKAMQETAQERTFRLSQEAKAAAERRQKNSRINELRSLISHLRTKLINSGYSKSVAGELSHAQHELYMLLMGF